MTKQRTQLALLASMGLFLLSTTWLLGPFTNHILVRGPNLISEYESIGMHLSGWFRFFDILGAVTLGLVSFWRRKHIAKRFGKYVPLLLYAATVLDFMDAFFPITCSLKERVCAPIMTPITIVHGAESFLTAGIVIGLAMYVVYRERRNYWLPISMIVCSLIGYLFHGHLEGLLFGLQVASTLLSIYVLWYVSLSDAFYNPEPTYARQMRHTIAFIVALSAIAGIIDSVLHISHHTIVRGLSFTANTAWLSQHTIVVSLLMLYLARSLWQGAQNAWRIVTIIIFLEIIRYAAFGHSYFRLVFLMMLFVLLITSKSSFTIIQSFRRFGKRLGNVVLVLLLTTAAVTILSVTFRYILTRQWEVSAFTPSRVIMRTLLLEVSDNPTDPLKARLLGQVLTAIGIFMYSWIFLGLFLPNIIPQDADNDDVQTLESLLHKFSVSSEDYFKLWPKDKSYWFNQNRTAAVAYKQSGTFLIALADPLTAPSTMGRTLREFHDFARSHGTKAAWLMVTEKRVEIYSKMGYTILPIGASAVVNIQKFINETLKDKWWRWKRNKATKSGLSYEVLSPPQSHETLDRLQVISNEWLKREGHTERGFALGYFDEAELRKQTIHVVKNTDGRIIAFANQLPTAPHLNVATIDLMRFMPGYDEALAYLLSETITSLHDSQYQYFDLGFVPLAHTVDSSTRKALLSAMKRILKPVFSSKGLEQFKNKFDPEWKSNYIAYDGDYIDALPVLNAINSALKIPEPTQTDAHVEK